MIDATLQEIGTVGINHSGIQRFVVILGTGQPQINAVITAIAISIGSTQTEVFDHFIGSCQGRCTVIFIFRFSITGGGEFMAGSYCRRTKHTSIFQHITGTLRAEHVRTSTQRIGAVTIG